MNGKTEKPDRAVATSLRKALAILEAVADADGPLTGQQIAVQVGLSRSTASRLALDLCELGYLAPLSNGYGFELGPAALRLGLRKFSSLDIRHQLMVMDVARDFAARGGGVVAILHDLNLAAMYADRIHAMHNGKLAAAGTPGEVLNDALIEKVFGCRLKVGALPAGGAPFVLPQSIVSH